MQEDKIRNPICKKCLRRIEYKLLKYGKHYVDSFWCKSCNVYYFRESDYFFYRRIWGNSVGNICIKDIEFAEWKKRAYYSKDISYSKRETVIGKNEVPVIEKKHILNTNEKEKLLQQTNHNIYQKNTTRPSSVSYKIKYREINLKDFVVRRNVFRCVHEEHNIEDITAAINIRDNNDKIRAYKVSAGYCSQCNTYFIMESTYQMLKKMGLILCRISDEKSYIMSYENNMQLASESLLMQYGYNVSKVEDLSSIRRQKILAVLIDNDIMKKSEIISYLDFFISQRANMSNMELAISKWEADREFVEYYRIGEYTQYGVNAIYRK